MKPAMQKIILALALYTVMVNGATLPDGSDTDPAQDITNESETSSSDDTFIPASDEVKIVKCHPLNTNNKVAADPIQIETL